MEIEKIETTTGIFVLALNTIEDNVVTNTRIYISVHDTLEPHKVAINDKDDDAYSNNMVLFSNAKHKTKRNATVENTNSDNLNTDKHKAQPAWTLADWEGPPPNESTATVVVMPSRVNTHTISRDWRSSRLGNIFSLFSRHTK